MKRSIVCQVIAVLCSFTLHAQKNDFISISASTDAARASLVSDNDPKTGRTPGVSGNVNRVIIQADGITRQQFQRLPNIFVTYDPMNPGNPGTIREIHVGYANDTIARGTTNAGRPWLETKMPIAQRVESILDRTRCVPDRLVFCPG